MSKIRILAIPPDTHGVGKYRILDPFKYIGDNHAEDFHVDIAMNPDDDDNLFKNSTLSCFTVSSIKLLTNTILKELRN